MCAYTFICCCFILIINPSTCIIPNYFMLLLAVYSYVRTDPPPILHAAPHTTHPSPGRWGAEARAAGGWCPPQQDPEGTQQAVDGWWQPKVSEAEVAITYLGKHFVCPYPLKWRHFSECNFNRVYGKLLAKKTYHQMTRRSKGEQERHMEREGKNSS